MANDRHDTAVTSPPREWLFKSRGQVFGPVPEARLAALVAAGEIAADAVVASDDGAWRPLSHVPRFLVHLRRAEARARVESEVTQARKLARRRGAARGAAIGAAALLLAGLVATAVFWVAARRARTSALLDGFGEGIAIGVVTVGAQGSAPADDEIAIPDAPQGGSGPRPRHGAPAAPSSAPRPARAQGSAEGGDLVLAQYDPQRIQAVVARQQGSLAPCLRDEARRSPEWAGEIPIEFAVANDGRVAQLWVLEPRFKSGELRECLQKRLGEWRFEPFPGQRPVVALAFRIGR
jgi:hypothetical protein